MAGDYSIEQSIRLKHCSHPTKDKHSCVGKCVITPGGLSLECVICGDNSDTLWEDFKYKKLERALSKIGIDGHLLDPIVLRSMLRTLYE